MNKIDRLQNTVNKAFGNDTTILRSNERYVLVRYNKGGHIEYATLRHDWDRVGSGHYFTAWFDTDYKIARDNAISDYNNRI